MEIVGKMETATVKQSDILPEKKQHYSQEKEPTKTVGWINRLKGQGRGLFGPI
jgi:hypothetical protein